MTQEELPGVIIVGPVADRTFTADGRIVIDYATVPSWSPSLRLEDLVARARLLSLVLDALEPTVDSTVGARRNFLLTTHIDSRVDTRAGGTPPRLFAYGTMTTAVIRRRELESLVDIRNEPFTHQGLFTFPRGADVPTQFGPGAGLTSTGDTTYFDKVLSFGPDGHRSARRLDKAVSRWTKTIDGWRRKAPPSLRALEGPWT